MVAKFFKSELFSCSPKVDHVIKSCKEPIALYPLHTLKRVLFCEVEIYQFCNSQKVHFVKASKYI